MTPKVALVVAGTVAGEIVAAGALFAAMTNASLSTGVYWAVETVSTVGYGDVAPDGGASRAVAIFVMLTAVPLLGALFAGLTSMHITRRVEASEHRLNARLDAHHEAIKQHIDNVAVAATAVATEEN